MSRGVSQGDDVSKTTPINLPGSSNASTRLDSDPYANCDASTISPVLDAGEFLCVLNAFRAGYP